MGDDIAIKILLGRLDPSHQGDVATEMQSSRVLHLKITAGAIEKSGLVTRAKPVIAGSTLPGQRPPLVNTVGVARKTSTIGPRGKSAWIGRRHGRVFHSPIADRPIGKDLRAVAGG